MKRVGVYIAFILALTLLGGCGGNGCNVVPNITVREGFSQGSHPNLFAAFGSGYLSGGVCGLIVYNKGDGFVAYDRCSTVNPEQRNALELVGANIVSDPVSGAKWDLTNGFPMSIAECPLKPYRVGVFGGSYLVTN
ncbi:MULTISPECIES: hypothetical protein [Sphingobacterium]|uniref:hypothetical protein n=1 Tax=Sphingobacterium TaxID=28453 RepID=UPI0013D93CF2|nr:MULTISPECIES: hypothetical protein [unclassified Sphingobacterium]